MVLIRLLFLAKELGLDIFQAFVLVFRSKYSLWIAFVLCFLAGRIYGRITKSLMLDLNLELTADGEIWQMVKEESRKGNAKARWAFICYRMQTFCLFLFIGMGLLNFVP